MFPQSKKVIQLMIKGEKVSYKLRSFKREWNELMISFDFKDKII